MEHTYYIPTSSLNFNNIISSESISPVEYYAKREYGIRRIVDIFNGQYKTNIILSDRLKYFSRPISDIEDHPMVVEIVVDENVIQPLGEEFYECCKPIYLTPYNTRFIFFTEHDRLVTESLSEHSIDVKLSSQYISRMAVEHLSEQYDFNRIVSQQSDCIFEEVLKLDERTNRLKGMLTGYYVGAMLSTNKTEISKLNILFDVQNEFSAIISSGAKYLYPEKETRLRELSTRWSKLSPLYRELESAKIDIRILSEILHKYGVKLPVYNLGISLHTQDLLHLTLEGETNPAMEWIEREIDKQQNIIRQSSVNVKPEDSEIIIDGLQVIGFSKAENQELLKHWFNHVLLDSEKTKMESYGKMELADMITDATIDLMGDNWKESKERVFLNKLRKHIGGEAFNVEWDNGALSSIAAVTLHGLEWDELLLFMQRKGMYDYRLAFAMYGALCGYANMSRFFVNPLYENALYGRQVYKEFFGQLFGKDISSISKTAAPITNTIQIETTHEAIKIECELFVQKIKESDKYSCKYDTYISQILDKKLSDRDSIRNLSGSKKDGWKSLIDGIEKKNTKKSKIESVEPINTPNLFSNISYCDDDTQQIQSSNETSIIFDSRAVDRIRECASLPIAIMTTVIGLFIEFQHSYQSGYYSEHPEQYRRNNSDVIDHFQKWCLSKKNKNSLPYSTVNREAMDSLKQYLLQYYHD